MALNILLAALLGLVQGLSEFLPISSSGHLVLMQTIFGIEEGALFFDTMLHLGTLISVFVVFRKQIWDILCHPIQKKTGMLLIATAVTAAIGFAFRDFFEGAFQGGLLAVGFLVTSALLFASERLKDGKKTIGGMKALDALGVGVVQGVAILPAISRSGATIAGCRFFGLDKKDAAEFSFLLSIPAILGAVIVQVPDVLREGLVGADIPCVIVGILVAAVSGYFAVRFMLKLIVKKSLIGFAFYTGALGLLVFLDQFVFHVFF